MNLISKAYDFYRLWRSERDPDFFVMNSKWEVTYDGIQEMVSRYSEVLSKKPKGSVERMLFASLIHKLRDRFTFDPVDYSQAKELYEDYFKIPNHIPSIEHLLERMERGEVYVVSYRGEAPIRGKAYSEYFINSRSFDKERIYRAIEVSKIVDSSIILSESLKDSPDEYMSPSFFTSFRYATEEEKDIFKKSCLQREKLKRELKELNKKHRKEESKLEERIRETYFL